MPENIEADLSWPKSGLLGVPDSDNPLVQPAGAPPAAEGNGAGGNGGEREPARHAAPAPVDMDEDALSQRVSELSHALHELVGATSSARLVGEDGGDGTLGDAALGRAEDSLRRLEDAAGGIAAQLADLSAELDRRLHGLRTPLEFPDNVLTDGDPNLVVRTEFRGGIPGVNTDPVGSGEPASSAVTWPPWAPARKASVWSRFTRSNIAVPLLLIAVIAVAGATYKLVKHVSAPPATPGISQTTGGVSSYGSVKVIAGETCHAGTTTATAQLTAVQAKSGTYLVSVVGTLSNGGKRALSHVVVGWSVTYADGYSSTQEAPITGGGSVDAKSTKTFYALAPYTDGSVPPASVQITGIGGIPTQPACT